MIRNRGELTKFEGDTGETRGWWHGSRAVRDGGEGGGISLPRGRTGSGSPPDPTPHFVRLPHTSLPLRYRKCMGEKVLTHISEEDGFVTVGLGSFTAEGGRKGADKSATRLCDFVR